MTQWHLVLPNKGLEISKSNNQFQYHVCLLICCFLTMLAWSSNINLNECKSNYHVKILIPATMCTCVLIYIAPPFSLRYFLPSWVHRGGRGGLRFSLIQCHINQVLTSSRSEPFLSFYVCLVYIAHTLTKIIVFST